MKALIILNLEDCTFDEIDEAEIKEINLVYQDKETGNRYEFEWETGFKIVPMPQKVDELSVEETMITKYGKETLILEKAIKKARQQGYNKCIDEILRGNL